MTRLFECSKNLGSQLCFIIDSAFLKETYASVHFDPTRDTCKILLKYSLHRGVARVYKVRVYDGRYIFPWWKTLIWIKALISQPAVHERKLKASLFPLTFSGYPVGKISNLSSLLVVSETAEEVRAAIMLPCFNIDSKMRSKSQEYDLLQYTYTCNKLDWLPECMGCLLKTDYYW